MPISGVRAKADGHAGEAGIASKRHRKRWLGVRRLN
jgi:hypothetical protein